MIKLADNLNDIEKLHSMLSLSPVATDMVTSLCGTAIGQGCYRSVFEYNLDPRYVIKVEPLNTGCNINEWSIWNEVQYLQGDLGFVKDWFAPVKWISPNGRILVMRKTNPHKWNSKKKRPERIPKFLTDIHVGNFGWIGKKYVCHDYGQLHGFMSYPKSTRKVDWDKLD